MFNVSVGTMYHLVHQVLGLRKLTKKWVPHVLSDANKQQRIECCRNLLDSYSRQPNAFLKAILTMDESWIYAFDILTRTESMEWVKDHQDLSKRPKLDTRKEKVLLCFWWDCEGMLFAKFLEPGSTIMDKQ